MQHTEMIFISNTSKGGDVGMKKAYVSPKVEFVMFGAESIVRASECDFDCPENCDCYGCVGVCTWDCTSDDSTCTTKDFNP